LIEPYIIVLSSVILAACNFALWMLLFDEEFYHLLESHEGRVREQLRRENEEFVEKMKGILELDPEAVEVVGFGENWKKRLERINNLKREVEDLRRRTVWVYYWGIASLFTASTGLLLPKGLEIGGFTLYPTALGWWLLVIGVLVMVGLLVHYQVIENTIQPTPQGKPIPADQGPLENMRKRLPL